MKGKQRRSALGQPPGECCRERTFTRRAADCERKRVGIKIKPCGRYAILTPARAGRKGDQPFNPPHPHPNPPPEGEGKGQGQEGRQFENV